jgi:hypothetical protein
MKKVLVVLCMMIMMISVKAYAGKGLFGCCCGGGDVGGGGSLHGSLVPNLGVEWTYNFEGFKKYYTADGDCEMRTDLCFRSKSIEVEEDLKAGRGQKVFVIVGEDWMHKRVKGDVSIHLQSQDEKGTIIQKGSIIDCEGGEIRRPGGGSSSEKGIGIPVDLYRRLGYLK